MNVSDSIKISIPNPKIFALTLIIVFGTSLFSCNTQKGEVEGTKTDTVSVCEPQITDTLEQSVKSNVAVEQKKGKNKKVRDTISESEDTTFKIKVFVGEDPY